MAPLRAPRLPTRPPVVSPPPPFTERRTTFRRAGDRAAHQERVLLARSLDILALPDGAEARLGGLLALLARTVGARRAAVLADAAERRVAVAVTSESERPAAEALAAWLDAAAPRSRARRAAAAPAEVTVVDAPDAPAPRRIAAAEPHRAFVEMPNAGSVSLGFDFDDADGPESLSDRLPAGLARHAAVALALVTEQVATERELIALRARETERARYVSTVAHELRTPLTGLSGYLDLLADGRVDDAEIAHEFVERSRDIVGTMGELVSDLLELSRLESGTLALEIGPFSVAESGARVVAGIAPIALERQLDLRSDLPPRLRAASGDRRRVEQILMNLLGNAVKFTPAGGTVELAARFDGPVAIFAVRDDGPGIDAEDRPRIFERFYRMRVHERVTGTGLGLPIARDLARAMDGDLEVVSVPGSGTAFVLALPGPARVEPAVVTASLVRSVAAEGIRLEDRAILRALSAVGGEAVSVRRPEGATGSVRTNRSPSRRGSSRPVLDRARALNLRAIDGNLSPRTAPA